MVFSAALYVLVYDFGLHYLPLFLIYVADSFAFKDNVDHFTSM